MSTTRTQRRSKRMAFSILLSTLAFASPVFAQSGDCGAGCMEFDLEARSGNTGSTGRTGDGGSGGGGGNSGGANGGDARSAGTSGPAAPVPEALVDQSNDGGSIGDVKGGAAGQSSFLTGSGAQAGQASGGGDSNGGDASSGTGGTGGAGKSSGSSGDSGASGDTCPREEEGGAPLCAQTFENSTT